MRDCSCETRGWQHTHHCLQASDPLLLHIIGVLLIWLSLSAISSQRGGGGESENYEELSGRKEECSGKVL